MKHHSRCCASVQAPQPLLLAFCLLSIPLGLMLFLPLPVYATAITVDTVSDAIAVDGKCSLREAIQAANTNAIVNECPAGVLGLDTITITATGTITLSSILPAIADPLAINGPGASFLTISGNNAVK
jgi:CSLREA domain-containing protein